MKTIRELCLLPVNGEVLPPERISRIEAALVEDHRSDLPWYVRLIVGIGAWFASGFFFAFAMALVDWKDDQRTAMGVVGLIILALAVVVGRQKWGIFAAQGALAVSLAAQGLIYYGFLPEQHHVMGTAALFAVGLAAALYFAYPDFLSRLITCFGALLLTRYWLYSGGVPSFLFGYGGLNHLAHYGFVYWALHLVVIAACFLRGGNSARWAPLGYALIVSLVEWQIEALARTFAYNYEHGALVPGFHPLFYIQPILTALAIWGVAVWAAGGISVLREKAPMFLGLGLALAALVGLGSGGILLALFFLLLGFSLQNGPILGLGLLLLPLFIFHYYYYNLNLDLLTKSGVLIGSGAVLLMLRAGLKRWMFVGAEELA